MPARSRPFPESIILHTSFVLRDQVCGAARIIKPTIPCIGNNIADAAHSTVLAEQFHPGTRVAHKLYGTGRVITVAMRGGMTCAKVEFGTRVKTMILEHAKLERLSAAAAVPGINSSCVAPESRFVG